MSDQHRQFRILYRDFLSRIVDLELLSPRGRISNLLGQFAALVAALNFTIAVFTVPFLSMAPLPQNRLIIAASGQEEFLIATSMAVSGLFTVLGWNVILPDRRDALVLGVLPLRVRTIFLARLAAVATALGISIVAVNIFTGLSYPFLLVVPGSGVLGVLRGLAAYWTAMAGGGLIVFCALLALQGIACQVLSYRLFLRLSSVLQLGALFTILGVYFLTPPLASIRALTAPENQRLLNLLPSFWFLGLLHQINGSFYPALGTLPARALSRLAIVVIVAAVTYPLAYLRYSQRIIEQPEIAPADRSRSAARVITFLAQKLFSPPLTRAVLLFTARTIARSRQHRLLLAIYGGIGFAIALAYLKRFLYNQSRELWSSPSVPLLAAGLAIWFFCIVGVRVTFALPVTLPANWIFRITQVRDSDAYFVAVRKTLFALAVVPLWIVSAAGYLAVWPAGPALQHLTVLLLLGTLLTEILLLRFRKLPFACSYLPGKANLKLKLGVYGILFLLLVEAGAEFEFWVMQSAIRFVVLCTLLLFAVGWLRWRSTESAESPLAAIQFEDLPPADIMALDLRHDCNVFDSGRLSTRAS